MMSNIAQVQLVVSRAEGASAELTEETARSLLRLLNEAQPGAARFNTVAAESGSKQLAQQTAELIVSVTGVASAWLVPALQHWWKSKSPDTGLYFKSGEFEVQIKGSAPPEVFEKVSQAIAEVTRA